MIVSIKLEPQKYPDRKEPYWLFSVLTTDKETAERLMKPISVELDSDSDLMQSVFGE